jgi:hypothetical protein
MGTGKSPGAVDSGVSLNVESESSEVTELGELEDACGGGEKGLSVRMPPFGE